MTSFLNKLKLVFTDSGLRKKVLVVLVGLAFFRLLAAIPIPGVNEAQLTAFLNNNQFFGLLNVFSGGGLTAISIVMLGVGPYITASIIMQLLTVMSPRIKSMYTEEGTAGRMRFTQYGRLLTLPLAIMQSFAFIVILQRSGVVVTLDTFHLFMNVAIITAGSMFVMWIGEVLTEFGIGSGTSMIIFAGIVSVIPQKLGQFQYTLLDAAQLPMYIGLGLLALFVIWAIVYITEAERPIPVTYSKQVRGGQTFGGAQTYLPLRLNQAGVIPIIFAISLLLLPQMLFNILSYAQNATLNSIGASVTAWMANPWIYSALYFVLVVLFTYFYTAITFDPKSMAENLQKNGAFIPGVRPGEPTSEYIGRIVTRITLVGALFLGIIAVLPQIVYAIQQNQNISIGGTSLLIAVSVVVDLIKKVNAHISMREY